jgi:hypothetical protein
MAQLNKLPDATSFSLVGSIFAVEFNGMPSAGLRSTMKENGMTWNPNVAAWVGRPSQDQQKALTAALQAEYAAQNAAAQGPAPAKRRPGRPRKGAAAPQNVPAQVTQADETARIVAAVLAALKG